MPVVVDMRIMGIDPGLQCTGYGLIDRLEDQQYRLIEGGVVPTDADQLLQHRLSTIFAGICEVMAEFEPDVAVVEKLYAKYSHPRTAIMMGHARGVIYLAGAQQAVPIRAYPAGGSHSRLHCLPGQEGPGRQWPGQQAPGSRYGLPDAGAL